MRPRVEKRLGVLEARVGAIPVHLSAGQERTRERYLTLVALRWPIPPRLAKAFALLPPEALGGVAQLIYSPVVLLPPVSRERQWAAARSAELE